MTDSEPTASKPSTPPPEYRRDTVVRRVAWRDILPWTRLFRALPLSLGVSVLTFALVASWLTPLGWQVGASLFLDGITIAEQDDATRLAAARSTLEDWPSMQLGPAPSLEQPATRVLELRRGWQPAASAAPVSVLRQLAQRILIPRQILTGRLAQRAEPWAYLAFGLLWSMLVWSSLGAAIARMTVLRVGRNARCGPVTAMKYCLQRCLSFWGAPLLPLAGVFGGAALLMLLGLAMRVDAIAAVVGVGWILILFGGTLLSLLLMGVTMGWPLMWCAVVTEKDGDAFDALSRSFAYVYQKFLRLAAYIAIAATVGWIGSVILTFFVVLTLELIQMFVTIGAGPEFDASHTTIGADWPNDGVQFWIMAWSSLPACYPFAAFWTSAAVIYLLRRNDIDGTEFDEVYSREDADRLPLPSLAADPQGVPQVAKADEGQSALASDERADTEAAADPPSERAGDSDQQANDQQSGGNKPG